MNEGPYVLLRGFPMPETSTLTITGMSCATCASTIEDAVASLAGVETVDVNFATDEATLTYDPDETALSTIYAASAESGSEHPLAQAIVDGATDRNLRLDDPTEFENVPGHGIRATIPQGEVLVGNRKLMRDNGVDPSHVEHTMERLERDGKTAMLVALDGELLGVVANADTVRESAMETVDKLHKRDYEVMMLTGDNERTGRAIGEQLGIPEENVHAEVLPEDKADEIDAIRGDVRPGTNEHEVVLAEVVERNLLDVAVVGDSFGGIGHQPGQFVECTRRPGHGSFRWPRPRSPSSMNMGPSTRNFVLTAHITVAVGWVGAVIAYLALVVMAWTASDVETVRAAWLGMEVIGWYVLVPLALAALGTGILMGIGTHWGIF